MKKFTVFDAVTGVSLRVFGADDRANVSIQSNSPNEVIQEGEWPAGQYALDIDGRTRRLGAPKALASRPALAVPGALAEQVKALALRMLRATDGPALEALETGKPMPPERARIRACRDALLAMRIIPTDFTDPKYWV